MHKVYIGLGTNLGRRTSNLRRAIRFIGESIGTVVRQSAFYVTKPWGFQSPRKFLNAVICVETSLSPHQLLETTQQIERDMGRRHKTVDGQYTDRVIDIDILLYDDLVIDEPNLKIPHPLMNERDFVMIPLNEIRD